MLGDRKPSRIRQTWACLHPVPCKPKLVGCNNGRQRVSQGDKEPHFPGLLVREKRGEERPPASEGGLSGTRSTIGRKTAPHTFCRCFTSFFFLKRFTPRGTRARRRRPTNGTQTGRSLAEGKRGPNRRDKSRKRSAFFFEERPEKDFLGRRKLR